MRHLAAALALLLALCPAAGAYSHSFTNQTSLPVYFWVNYASCSNDSWPVVNPGQTVTWRSGLCCISAAKIAKPEGVKLASTRSAGQHDTAAYLGAFGTILTFGLNGFLLCGNTNWRAAYKFGGKTMIGLERY